MTKHDTIKHAVGRGIMAYLATHEYARFSDMRPPKVDTNLFTYHLKLLVKAGYIVKDDMRYTLSIKGKVYIDRHLSDGVAVRTQPRILVVLLIQDGYGNIVVTERHMQPYINTCTLPYGEMQIEDASVIAAAQRIATETLHYTPIAMRHVGDCYITVGHTAKVAAKPIEAGMLIDGDILHLNTMEVFQVETRTLMHVVRFETDEYAGNDACKWIEPLALAKMNPAPGIEQVISRSFFGDAFFFEEFRVELS